MTFQKIIKYQFSMLNSEFIQNSPLIEVRFNDVEVFPVFSCSQYYAGGKSFIRLITKFTQKRGLNDYIGVNGYADFVNTLYP